MTLPEDDQHIDRLREALYASRRPERLPVAMPLPDAAAELELWLADEAQWHHGSPSNWKSLVNDVAQAVGAYPLDVRVHGGDDADILHELKRLANASGQEHVLRSETVLRLRLRIVLDALAAGLRTSAALKASWIDLRRRCSSGQQGEEAARRLVALARWAGHDPETVRRMLLSRLDGPRIGPPALPRHRLLRAAQLLDEPPRRADIVVWLRLIYAPIQGEPMIELGSSVRLYQDEWLREILRTEDHPDSPAELACDPEGRLQRFASAQAAERDELPDAFLRVELHDVLLSDAIAEAKRTAATLGALGTISGGDPSLWVVDTSFLSFREGGYGPTSWIAPPVGSPTITERTAVIRDPTAAVLRANRADLARFLPVRGPMARSAQLLSWLRDASALPAPVKLVLCDRAIEAVSAWAGFASPHRFVEQDLAASWALRQIRNRVQQVALDIVYNDNRRLFPAGTAERDAWDELVRPLDLGSEENFTPDLARLTSQLDWIRERFIVVEPNRMPIHALADHLRSGRSAAAWFDELLQHAERHERRRHRTRNALMHGGPLAEGTVQLVLPFAEFLANEAVGRTVDAHLERVDVPLYFVQRTAKLREIRRLLKAGERPDSVLFG